MKRGITFAMPNGYGDFLGKALQLMDLTQFHWRIGNEESYTINNGSLGEDLFADYIEGVSP